MSVDNKATEGSKKRFQLASKKTLVFFIVTFAFLMMLGHATIYPNMSPLSLANISAWMNFYSPQKYGLDVGHNRTTMEHMWKGDLTILFFNKPSWLPSGEKITGELNKLCPHLRCSITTNKKDLDKRSAIIFSIQDNIREQDAQQLLKKRNSNQPWMFFYHESPQTISKFASWFNNKHWLNTMNWSVSYQTDSDVSYPYAILKPKAVEMKNYSKIFHQKEKFAAWMVSHCITKSKREKYVEQLQSWGIPIDIYGGCSKRELDRNLTFVNEFLEKRYKFYLSFENTLCRDYITEKFYSHYNYDLILVARGGSGYSKLVKNGTYINTADFGSIKDLADYLLRLNSSEALYTEYIKRKNEFPYRVEWIKNILFNNFCNICEKVRNQDKFHKQYYDLRSVVFKNTCRSPTDL